MAGGTQEFTIRRFSPHFHAEYAGRKSVIGIEDCRVLQGGLTRRGERLVLDWAAAHRKELLEDWALCQNNELPRPIEPLE